MSILFYCNWPNKQEWISNIKTKFKRKKIYIWPNIVNYEEIEYAIIWNIPRGVLKKFPNLKIIFSLGAGVDHILKDNNLPNIPIVRLKDPIMGQRMANYVLCHILNYQIGTYTYLKNQYLRLWKEDFFIRDNDQITVGILGYGYLGKIIAKVLIKRGYKVQAYKRSRPLKSEKILIYYNKNDLKKFIKKSDVIINILPKTIKTINFINSKFLNHMKKNSILINVGRGDTVNEKALLKKINSNSAFIAVLDVFNKEPLPKKHSFWKKENLYITPHISSLTEVNSAVDQIHNIYKSYVKTKRLKNTVNKDHQY